MKLNDDDKTFINTSYVWSIGKRNEGEYANIMINGVFYDYPNEYIRDIDYINIVTNLGGTHEQISTN
jgi:hypothetical protein